MTVVDAEPHDGWTACERRLHMDRVLIGKILDVLEAMLDRKSRGGRVDPEMVAGVLRFIRAFVHESHERQVVEVLAALAERDVSIECREAAELLQGYVTADQQLSVLRMLEPVLGRAGAERKTMAQARGIVFDCRRQLHLERAVLSRFAGALASGEDESLMSRLATIERNAIGPTGREWYTQMALDYRDIVSTWASGPAPRA